MAGKSSHEVRMAILKALSEAGGAVGGVRLAELVQSMGVNLKPRSVRFHLLQLDRDGLTRFVSRRRGRELADAGREELQRSDVMGKVGFVAARVDTLGYRLTFDPATGKGTVVANICLVDSRDFARAVVHMEPVFQSRLSLGQSVAVAMKGEAVAGYLCPRGRAVIAPLCSVTVNGVFLKAGVPIVSRFGGLLELRQGKPVRFVELIEYEGTSVDPLELFIRAGMTQVRACAATGNGIIGASFREFPSAAYDRVRSVVRSLDAVGLGGVLAIGRPNCPLLDVPVPFGRTGMIVIGGLNPVAAMQEAGIPVELYPLAGLEDISRFRPFGDVAMQGRRRVAYVE